MELKLKQISSLEKIFPCGIGDVKDIYHKTLMKGENFSYQIAIEVKENMKFTFSVASPLKDHIELYAVRNIISDYPTYADADEDYLAKTPTLIPDMLVQITDEKDFICLSNEASSLWVRVKVPEDIDAGEYPVSVTVSATDPITTTETTLKITLDVINATLPKQEIKFTQWFHTDCIASVHNVEIYSEEHWDLIDKYMALAYDLGLNMLLTPVVTPPLDTAIGHHRPCTQLVRIEKKGAEYLFDFSLLERWINLCIKNNITYFEISHLFTQWGLKHAPNIKVTENGEESFMFGWHTDSHSEEYKDFLTQFVPALIDFLDSMGVKDRCWFHVSDEPLLEHIPAYTYAQNILTPLLKGCPTFDAISNYDFYETGLIKNPVVSTNHIEPFIENDVKNLWAYYCCAQYKDVGNRFLAMPSYRNRILGLQLYKYNAVGFLQWGYNFYFSQFSLKKINPYITTSCEKAFPSGDSFSVYPTDNGVVPSLRGLIFKEALEDIEKCRVLEGFIGRDKVIEMIDNAAGMNITFSQYPRNPEFIPELIEKIELMIKSYTA